MTLFVIQLLLKSSMLMKKAEPKQRSHSPNTSEEAVAESGFASYETIGQPASDKEANND